MGNHSSKSKTIFIQEVRNNIPPNIKHMWYASDSVIESTIIMMYDRTPQNLDPKNWENLRIQPKMILPYIPQKYTDILSQWRKVLNIK